MKCLGISVIWSTSCYLAGLGLLVDGTSIFIYACSMARLWLQVNESPVNISSSCSSVISLSPFTLKSLDVSGLFVNVAAKTLAPTQ